MSPCRASPVPEPAVRPIDAEDPTAIAALHARCFPHEAWSRHSFEQLLASPGVCGWLLESSGERQDDNATPEGFILLRIAADEAEILTFCVAPEQRQAGLGSRLLATALPRVRLFGAHRVLLEVARDNAAALALYQRFGFAEVGRRPNYYTRKGERVDALLLAHDLP